MALSAILNERQDTPYARPPPIHVSILKLQLRTKVLTWTFVDSRAIPTNVKKKQIAAISDGQTVTTTTLFEEFAGRVEEGRSYVMRGYELRGQGPPFRIFIMPRTQFFRSSVIDVAEDLHDKAKFLLEPPAPLTSLMNSLTTKSLITVEGEVIEVSEIKKVGSGKQQIPLRTVRVRQDACSILISLWREAATEAVAVGESVTVSHVKVASTSYGDQLQSTTFTVIKAKQEVLISKTIVGVMAEQDSNKMNMLSVLFEDGRTASIREELWAPFESRLEMGEVKVDVKITGNTIQEIKGV